jgi:hypothetical protein
MGQDFVVVLAPEAQFAALGGWDKFPGNLPSWATPRVVEALRAFPGIQNEGLTFWTDDLEEFEIEPDNIQSIFLSAHGDAGGKVLQIALHLAQSFGPVTLIRTGTDERVQIESGMTQEMGAAGWKRPASPVEKRPSLCPKCGRKPATRAPRCMYCGEKL